MLFNDCLGLQKGKLSIFKNSLGSKVLIMSPCSWPSTHYRRPLEMHKLWFHMFCMLSLAFSHYVGWIKLHTDLMVRYDSPRHHGSRNWWQNTDLCSTALQWKDSSRLRNVKFNSSQSIKNESICPNEEKEFDILWKFAFYLINT